MKDNWWESAPLAEETPASAPNVSAPSGNWWEEAPLAESTLGLLDSASKTGYANNAKYNQALYERTGDPSFLAEAQKYTAMGGAINGIPQQSSHSMELGADLGANLEIGGINVSKIPNQIASYLTDPNAKEDDDSIWRNGGTPNNIVEDAINSGSTKALQKMTALQDQIAAQKSDFSRSPQQNIPFISKSTNPNDLLPWNVIVPSISQASTIAGNVYPSIGLFEGGGEAAPFIKSLGGTTTEQTMARAAGYGVGNAAISAPQAYEDTYNQAYADNIKNGMTQKDADSDARVKADKVMNEVAPIALAVGAAGGKLAPEVTGSAPARFIKGSAVGSVPMGVQGGAQYIAEQNALGKPIDPYELANQVGTNAIMAAPMEGGIAVRDGKRGSSDTSKINAETRPVLTDTGEVRPDRYYNPVTGETELHTPTNDSPNNPPSSLPPSGGGGTPIAPAADARIQTLAEATADAMNTGSPTDSATIKSLKDSDQIRYNTDAKQWEAVPEKSQPVDSSNAQAVIDAINSNGNVAPGAVGALLQSGEIQFNNGRLELANKLSPTTNIDTATATLNAIKSGDLKSAGIHSDTVRDFVRSGEITHDQNGRLQLTDLGEKLHAELNNPTLEAPENAPIPPQEQPKAAIVNTENKTSVPEAASTPENKASPVLENATPAEEKAIADYQNAKQQEIPFSVTPSDKFIAQQEGLKAKVTNIIKKINPSVDVSLVDKMFGEGEALKASGAKDTSRQEVAGAYDKLKNVVHASLDTEKWNPEDTAYHEAYHSVRDMVTPSDDAILKKAFSGTDTLSQPEYEAVEFGRFMTEKNAAGFAPAVRRIFSSIRQAFRDIGRAFKFGKFNSVEDIFNRIERGSIYKDYQDTLRNGDVESLAKSNLSPEQQKNAIKEVSPALHDIVYSTTPKDDMEALKDINIQAHGTPEQKASVLGNDVYGRLSEAVNKGLDTVESAKEKMLHASVDLLKPIIGEKTYEKAKRSVDTSIAKTKRSAGGLDVKRTAANVGHIMVSSNDGHLRAIGSRTGSKQVVELADTFHPDPGHAKSLKMGYHEEIQDFTNRTLTKAANLLKDVHNQADKDAIRDYMTNPSSMTKEVTKSGNGYIAVHLSKMIEDMRAHLHGAGVDVPKIEGFYPRIYHTNYIVNNEKAFRKDAALAYFDTYKDAWPEMFQRLQDKYTRDLNDQRNYEKAISENVGHEFKVNDDQVTTQGDLNRLRQNRLDEVTNHFLDKDGNLVNQDEFIKRTIQNRVDAWYNNILLQDDGITVDPNGYFRNVSTIPDAPSSFKQRLLSKNADDILTKYMVKDPLSAMTKLTTQTARKAAWENHFGGGKLEQIHRNLVNDGLSGVDIRNVMNIVRSNTGQLGSNIDGSIKHALALARYWTALRFLAKAPFKHLNISLNAGSHTANMANAWRTLVDSTNVLFKTNKGEAMRIYAELAGLSGEAAEHALLMNQSGLSSDNDKLNYMTNKYFDTVGMTHLVGAHKAGMIPSIQYFLGDLAKDVTDRKNGFKSAEFFMKNYGIPANEVTNFSNWIKDNGGSKIDQTMTLGNDQYAKMYRLAQQRAVNQIISNPTAATRQMYASHPVGGVIYHMTAYHMTAMKNSLQRNARLFAEGINPSSDIDMKDRLRFVSPMVMYLSSMTLFGAAFTSAKNAAFPPDKKDKNSHIAEGIVGADLGAQFNFLIKDIIGSKYLQNKLGYKYDDYSVRDSSAKKAIELFGPDVSSLLLDYPKMIANLSNNLIHSGKKKDAEIKDEYNLVTAPMITSFVATHAPAAAPFSILAFAAIQAINHPSVRRFLTGAKQPK